jgi:hypothetical protein
MAKLTKADAARQLGIARSTLYKLIDQGKVSPTPDGLIDQAELVRVAAYADTIAGRPRTPADIHVTPAQRHAETPDGRPQTPNRGRPQTDDRGRPQTSSDTLVDILLGQIQVLRDELQQAHAREEAAREREALLLHMVEQMQQRYDRLLDMPRPLPQASPQDAPGATQARRRPESPPPPQEPPQGQPAAQGGDPRGDMRRRIVALLQDYPEGLTPAEMRELLGVGRSLADTCLGMLRYGLVQRVERGRYVAAGAARHDQA